MYKINSKFLSCSHLCTGLNYVNLNFLFETSLFLIISLMKRKEINLGEIEIRN